MAQWLRSGAYSLQDVEQLRLADGIIKMVSPISSRMVFNSRNDGSNETEIRDSSLEHNGKYIVHLHAGIKSSRQPATNDNAMIWMI